MSKHNIWSILLFTVSCSLLLHACDFIATEDTKLLFVQIIFRHGNRAPLKSYRNDPNPETVWPEGFGSLTLLGKKQHYALGKLFRRMYASFTTSSPNEVRVSSSETDRCIRSAESNLASFFAPSPEWKFTEDLNWQPITISYNPKLQDKYLTGEPNCPQIKEEMKRLQNLPENQAFLAKHQEMLHNLSVHAGEPIRNFIEAYVFYDTVFNERIHNLIVPSWVDPYWEELKEVADLALTFFFHSPLLHRLYAGPLLGRIIDVMESKLNGEIPLQKFQIYSTHDIKVAVVLDALNLYPMESVPYCASVLIELHEKADGGKAVRLLYLNSTTPEAELQEPHILVLDGCEEFCPLDYFINATKGLNPSDWEHDCKLQS